MQPYIQDEKYEDICGCRMCYVEEGQGPPLLLVHGLGGSIIDWAPVIERFKRDHRVIAVDLPGYGRSAPSRGKYDLDVFADAVLELMDSLGVDRTTIVGHSMGGLITMHLVLNYPERFGNVVFVDPAGGGKFPKLLDLAVDRLPPWFTKKVIIFCLSYLSRLGPMYKLVGFNNKNEYTMPLLENMFELPRRPDIDEYMDTYLASARTVLETSYSERLHEIDKPTLIVWGQKDMAISLKTGLRMNRAITGSFLVSIPDAAHVVQLDQPELFNDALGRFLAGTASCGN